MEDREAALQVEGSKGSFKCMRGRERFAHTKVCCLNDVRFDAMEHLRDVPVMVL